MVQMVMMITVCTMPVQMTTNLRGGTHFLRTFVSKRCCCCCCCCCSLSFGKSQVSSAGGCRSPNTSTHTHTHTHTHTLGQVHIPQARTSPQLDECRSFCLLVTPLASSSSGGLGALLPGPQHVLTIRRPPQRLPSPPTSLLVLLFIPLDPHGSPLPSQCRTIPV